MPDTTTPTDPINTYQQMRAAVRAGIVDKQHALVLSYEPAQRSPIHGWYMWSPLDWYHPDRENAAWYEKSRRCYFLRGDASYAGKTKDGVAVALKEAQRLTGITEWKRNRDGDFVPVQVQQRLPIKRSN